MLPTRQYQFYVLWTRRLGSAEALGRGGEALATMPRQKSKIPKEAPVTGACPMHLSLSRLRYPP